MDWIDSGVGLLTEWVESVTTTSGSRNYEKLSDITPLADLDDETAAIGDNDDPELTLIKYAIHRYAGITTVTNSLLKDTVENIMAWLSTWIARKWIFFTKFYFFLSNS